MVFKGRGKIFEWSSSVFLMDNFQLGARKFAPEDSPAMTLSKLFAFFGVNLETSLP